MDRSFYRDQLVLEGHLDSNNYKTLPLDADKKVMKNLISLVKKYEDCLTDKEQDFVSNFNWKTSHLYVLLKIHKSKDIIEKVTHSNGEFIEMQPPSTLKSRPIIAGPSSLTQRLSEFLDTLKPLAKTLKTYVKGDWDFLRKIPREFAKHSSLYSHDVTSLYTSIPHELGLQPLYFWIIKRRDLIPQRFSKAFVMWGSSRGVEIRRSARFSVKIRRSGQF